MLSAIINWWNGDNDDDNNNNSSSNNNHGPDDKNAELHFPLIPAKWICSVDQLRMDGEVLGNGGFTTVFRGVFDGNKHVAVKVFEGQRHGPVATHFDRKTWSPTTDPRDVLRGDEREVFFFLVDLFFLLLFF